MSKNQTENKNTMPIARQVRGFIDNRSDFLERRRELINAILKTYKLWSFEELETGAMEFADCLGKFLPDDDRPNEGVFALQDDDEQWLSLRYDLTAPLARFVAQNYENIPKPFRRSACGPVWRNEKPGPGRYREFWQCDADIVGSPLPQADAEIIAMLANALEAAGIAKGKYVIKVSNRKLLDGLLQSIGLDENDVARKLTILRALDKWDKFGAQGVSALLGKGRLDPSGDFTKGANLEESQIEKVIAFASMAQIGLDAFYDARDGILNNDLGKEGLEEIQAVFASLKAMNINCENHDSMVQVQFDTSIVRGLEYYTGIVFEAEFLEETTDENGNIVRFGSIGSGGRYDDLVMRFRGERVPATGCSIGISRLLAALECTKEKTKSPDGPVLILAMDKDQLPNYLAMANELRNVGIKAEVYMGTAGMKAQMKYADRKKAPLVIIEGSNEREAEIVIIKDLKLGAQLANEIENNEEWRKARPAQFEVKRSNLIEEIKKARERQNG